MMNRILYTTLFASALVAFAGGATPRPAALARQTSEAVETSYELLVKTFYHPVSAGSVLAGAARGIAAYDKIHGKSAPKSLSALNTASSQTVERMILDDASATRLPAEEVAYAAMKGMAASVGDRWTAFLSPKDLATFNAPLNPPSIYGIGVLLQQDVTTNYIRAFFVVPNGPADRAGLESGDLITEVDGRSTRGETQAVVSGRLRGHEGSVVHFSYQLPNGDRRDTTVTRGSVRVPTVVFNVLPGTQVGYIYISAFGAPTGAEFAEAVERLLRSRIRALVIDLRDDGGGYVSAAVSIVSHFIDSGPVVSSIGRDGNIFTQESDDEAPQIDVPAVVLVNGYTASASEIAAGALQDSGAAILLGTRTFGKGVEQSLTRLPDGSAIKITTARYLTPNNHDVNAVGLKPDVVCAESRGAILGDPSRDDELRCALSYLSGHSNVN